MGKGKVIILFLIGFICIFFGGASLNIQYSFSGYVFYAQGSSMAIGSFLLMLVAFLGSFNRHPAPMDLKRPAGIFRRFCALFIDFIVYVCIVTIPLVMLALIVESVHTGSFQWTVVRTEKRSTDSLLMVMIFISMLVLLIFFALHVHRRQQSIGQMIMGYAVISEYDDITLVKSVLRVLLGYLTMILFIISVPMALFRQDRRMWHDLVFKTFPRKWRPAD